LIELTKKAIELLDAVTSAPYSRKGLGYTIGHGLDAVLPFTCYSYWFSATLTNESPDDDRQIQSQVKVIILLGSHQWAMAIVT
jgi:hypothetical protein